MRSVFGGIAILLAVWGMRLDAGTVLRIDNGTNGVVIADNGSGDLFPVLLGSIQEAGLLGGFILSNTGNAFPPLPHIPAVLGSLDLNSADSRLLRSGTLNLYLETDNLPALFGIQALITGLTGVFVGPGGSSATFQSWVNTNNLVPSYGAPQSAGAIGAVGAVPAGSILGYSGTFSPGVLFALPAVTFTASGPYSLFLQTTIVLAGAGSADFHLGATVVAVPEPFTAGLLLSGVGVLVVLRRRIPALDVPQGSLTGIASSLPSSGRSRFLQVQ